MGKYELDKGETKVEEASEGGVDLAEMLNDSSTMDDYKWKESMGVSPCNDFGSDKPFPMSKLKSEKLNKG